MTLEYSSFLIRLWREVNAPQVPAGEWHGEVEHIQSGRCWTLEAVEALYFRDWPSLEAFMEELLRSSSSEEPRADDKTSEVCETSEV